MSDYWKETEKIASEPSPTTRPPVLYPPNETLLRKARNGAKWPWWLAAITVANLILAGVEAPLRFSFGLALPEILFEFGRAIGPLGKVSAVGLDVIFLGALVGLGFLNRKFEIWAYVVSLILIAVDSAGVVWLAYLGSERLMSLILHGYAIFSVIAGLQAAKLLLKRRKEGLWSDVRRAG